MERKFNAIDVLAALRAQRAERRKRNTWGKSDLSKFQAELVQLRKVDASFADLQFWLRTEKRVKVERSTILRFLKIVMPKPDPVN